MRPGGHRLGAVTLVVTLLGTLAVASGSASASGSSNSFVLSGQATGTVSVNKKETCTAGNISTEDGETTVRIYLTDHGVAPTKDLWYLLITSKGKSARFPSPTDTFTLGAQSGATIAEQWITSTTKGAGHVTFGAGFKSGVVEVTVPPSPYQKTATRDEKVVGSWSCS